MKKYFERFLLKKKQLLIIALFSCMLFFCAATFIQNIETYSPITASVVTTKYVLLEGETSVSMLYVTNNYPVRTIYPTKFLMTEGPVTRSDLYNAFIVDSIDFKQTINGTVIFYFPNITPDNNDILRGRWTTNINGTVEDTNTVRECTILPGETIAVMFSIDINFDKNQQQQYGLGLYGSKGIYEYTFTIYGTINGMPIDLTVKPLPIFMK